MKKNIWFILISLLLSQFAIISFAEGNKLSTEDRLNRLERLVNSKGLVDIMVRVESMQSELQRLLGEIEVQKHSLDEIKKRQRDLYVDLDRRLLQMERRSGSRESSTPVRTTLPQSIKTKTNKITPPPATAIKKAPVVRIVKKKEGEQVAYQKAFDFLRALRYEKATHAFRQFLINYPSGRYAHIAQYWLAETSYHTRKFEVAVKDYQTLIDDYPRSPKRADALLKIGYSQYSLKSFAKAKVVLKKLIETYPGTTEADQAQNLLRKIRLQK